LEYVIGVVDTAYTEKEENDYSAMTVWGVFSVGSGSAQAASRAMTRYGTVQQLERAYGEGSQQVIMLHAWQKKLAFPDLVKAVAKEAKQFKIDTVIIEDKAAGISLSQELRRSFRTEDFGVILTKPKGLDKVSRLYSVQHLFADGIIWAPDKEWAEMVIRQVSSFPKAKHDDLVDTVSYAMRYLRESGLLQRAPERLAELEEGMRFKGRSPAALYPV
jgi:predicted phage terminase large subunit-like protein